MRFILYMVAGVAIGVPFRAVNLSPAAAIFILTAACFLGIGVLWAGIVLLVKRGEALMTILSTLVLLLSGVLFPATLLPGWLQRLAHLIPLTDGLTGMRLALLQGASFTDLASILIRLAVFALVLLCAGIAGFNYAVAIARRRGSLAQY